MLTLKGEPQLMEPEVIRQYVAQNRELETQLTKRNQQYIFDLKKALKAANLSEEELALVMHEMLPVLVREQKSGVTARQLFGTVSERTDAIINQPTEEEQTNNTPVMIWLDNFLLLLGLFGLFIGLVAQFSKGQPQPYGVLTLLATTVVGGWAFYLMHKYIYQYQMPGADKSKRPKGGKVALILIGVFVLWFVAILGSGLIPTTINIILPPVVMIIIGVIALAVRFYVKKKFNIESTFGAPRPKK